MRPGVQNGSLTRGGISPKRNQRNDGPIFQRRTDNGDIAVMGSETYDRLAAASEFKFISRIYSN